jgi:hypothetical protein
VADLAFLATIVGFFLLCVAYVAACKRIVGPDELAAVPGDDVDAGEPTEERAAA